MTSLNRVAMAKSSRRMIRKLGPANLDVAEISGKWGQMFNFRSYQRFLYPEWDICVGPYRDEAGAVQGFDLILANQVWEHLDRPYAATRNVLEMLRPGGHFVATAHHIQVEVAVAVGIKEQGAGVFGGGIGVQGCLFCFCKMPVRTLGKNAAGLPPRTAGKKVLRTVTVHIANSHRRPETGKAVGQHALPVEVFKAVLFVHGDG